MEMKTCIEWRPLLVALAGALLMIGMAVAFVFVLTS